MPLPITEPKAAIRFTVLTLFCRVIVFILCVWSVALTIKISSYELG